MDTYIAEQFVKAIKTLAHHVHTYEEVKKIYSSATQRTTILTKCVVCGELRGIEMSGDFS